MFGKNKSTGSIEYIVVGLGNPDRKYENTRHNAGWLAIDRIADKLGCDVNKIKYKSFIGTCTVNGAKVMLMKPTTYMNNSGQLNCFFGIVKNFIKLFHFIGSEL